MGVEKFGRFKVNSPMPGSSTGGAVAEGSSALPGEPRIFGAQAPAVSFFLGGRLGGRHQGPVFGASLGHRVFSVWSKCRQQLS